MVTASYVTSRAIPVELPKGATGEGTPTTLTISIDKDGKTFLDAEAISKAALQAKIKAVARRVIRRRGRSSPPTAADDPLERHPRDRSLET